MVNIKTICLKVIVWVIIVLSVYFVSFTLLSKSDRKLKIWNEEEIHASDLDLTMTNVTTSQEQEWSYPDNYGFNVTMNLNYEDSLDSTGQFIPKMFVGDGGLGHYIYHRYQTTPDGFWNDSIFYIDSYCSSIAKSLSISDWNKEDFTITYYRNESNKRDEFRLICKNKDKYNIKDKLILTYLFLDEDTYRTVYLSEWIQEKLDLNKNISDELSQYKQESISESSGGVNP